MYRERASRLAGAVVWERTVPAGGDAGGDVLRVLPDGCQDLIWVDGGLLVAGPDTVAQVTASAPGTRFTGLRFAPGTATAVLGVPAHELRDRRIALADVWPVAEARRATARVATAQRPADALERIAGARLEAAPPDPSIPEIVRRLAAGVPVPQAGAAVGLGERRLHRRCLAVFGYGPKTLTRILRLNRALDLARAGTPFALVAATAGYADQAHLAREVKALAGVPLGALVG